MKDKDLIRIANMSFAYHGASIFEQLNITFEAGKSYALIGQSGCGKSTLLNLIVGYLKPDSGDVVKDGEINDAHSGKIGYLFQDLALFPWQTVMEAVRMPLDILERNSRKSNLVRDGAMDMADTMLKELGIWDKRTCYPKQLSGGEKQRVALARTLVSKPNLLLMDEPTSALDMMTKEVLQKLILKEQQKRGFTMIFVTHDIEEAVYLGETILVMKKDGEIAFIDNPYFAIPGLKDQLDYYQFCIELRYHLGLGGQKNEA